MDAIEIRDGEPLSPALSPRGRGERGMECGGWAMAMGEGSYLVNL
jgi:hypothetical protein